MDFDAWTQPCELALGGPPAGFRGPVEYMAFLNETDALLLSADGLYLLRPAPAAFGLLVSKPFVTSGATLWESRVLYMYAPAGDAIHAVSGPRWDRLSLVSSGAASSTPPPSSSMGLFYASAQLSPGTLWLVVAGVSEIQIRALFPAHTWVHFHHSPYALLPAPKARAPRPLKATLAPTLAPGRIWVLTVELDTGEVYTLSSDRVVDALRPADASGVPFWDALAAAFLARHSGSLATESDALDWHAERRGGGPPPADVSPVPASHLLSRWFLSVSQRGTYSAFERAGHARALGIGAAALLDAPACYDVLRPAAPCSDATLHDLLANASAAHPGSDDDPVALAGLLGRAVDAACGAAEPVAGAIHPLTGALWLARGGSVFEIARAGARRVGADGRCAAPVVGEECWLEWTDMARDEHRTPDGNMAAVRALLELQSAASEWRFVAPPHLVCYAVPAPWAPPPAPTLVLFGALVYFAVFRHI